MQATALLKSYYFEKYLLEVAIATLEKGMSASKLNTYHFLAPIDAWGFPKYPGKTAILPPECDLLEELRAFIARNRPFLLEADSWLGTWIHPVTQQYYLDVTTSRVDLEDARREAIARSQQEGRQIVALYNSYRDQTVYLWDGSESAGGVGNIVEDLPKPADEGLVCEEPNS